MRTETESSRYARSVFASVVIAASIVASVLVHAVSNIQAYA
jgi:hypothetical protein